MTSSLFRKGVAAINRDNEAYSSNANNALYLITKKLNEKHIPYAIEKNDGLIHIYFDKDKNLRCSICDLDVKVGHLKGYRVFNLDEGDDYDILSINNALEHLFEIMSNDLVQVETYKLKKLCSVNQYMIVNGEKISCSGEWILHMLYFAPFIKKEVKEVRYRWSNNEFVVN